jgi:ABC-type antimicrobial peptide transport system ATPase subunit
MEEKLDLCVVTYIGNVMLEFQDRQCLSLAPITLHMSTFT